MTWPLNGSEAGVDLVLIQNSVFFSCVNQVVFMFTSLHLNEKAERSVSKQGHLQPRFDGQETKHTTVK